MNEKKPTFYDQLMAVEVIEPMLQYFANGSVVAESKTKKFKMLRQIGLQRQWTFARSCPDRKCAKWFDIYFELYKILPPPCKQCWKIVYVPNTVVELMDIQKFQEMLNLPAKCGIEGRDYTSGLGCYRAFWYAPFFKGLAGARIHFNRIKSALIKHFVEDYILEQEAEGRFYLKRGCTEMERDFGPSENWDTIDHSVRFNLLEAVWEDPERHLEEFSPLRITNFKRWIEFAIAHGDKTALKFVRGKTLGVPSVKYQDSNHNPKDYKNYIEPFNGFIEKEEDKTSEPTKENLFGFESSKG